MTAEIGILNKTAIVLAGDSAVTIGDGKKVYNTANKIFQLTHKGTVGIMIYNQANWMGIPLETVIKTFYKEFGDSTLAALDDYRNSFIKFLKSNFYKHISPNVEENLVKEKCIQNLSALIEVAVDLLEEEINGGKISKPTDESAEVKEIAKRMTLLSKYMVNEARKKKSRMIEFKGYRLTSFKTKFSPTIKDIVSKFLKEQKIKYSPAFLSRLISLLYYDIVVSLTDSDNYSGVVIAGFGHDEIFPKIIEFKLGEVFENRLRIETVKKGEINDNTVAIISPFAQRDMVDTFMQGIEPRLQRKLYSILDGEFKNLASQIGSDYNISDPKLHSRFEESFNNIRRSFFEYKDKRYVQPIVDTVSFLNKEGIIELAESLVNITSLKRKTSSDIESVGGPVDIALITKGDGFQWIKRKEFS